MDLEQRYREAYRAMGSVIESRLEEKRYMALGYTSNLDLLCDFRTERLNRLLEQYVPEGNLYAMKAAEKIETIRDLAETLVFYCLRGIGGEAEVVHTDIVEENFSFTYGIGGTAAQAAMALSEIGCPSVVHLTDDSGDVCRIMDTPFIYTVSRERRLVHTGKASSSTEREIHFIVQFMKGDRILLGGQEAEIPCSNRLILTKTTVNEELPFSEPYFTWIEEHAKQVSSNVISGFNVLQDKEVLEKRVGAVKDHIGRYRGKNPKGIAFYEDSFYHDTAVGSYFRQVLYPYVDVVSMNEEELETILRETYHPDFDVQDIFSCIEGVRNLRERFSVRKGIIVHTKDYSMYVGDALDADIERGLMYGNMLATAKAMYGWYGTMEQLGEVVELGLSRRGTEYYRKIQESGSVSDVIIVPSKYIDAPRYAIGLGDSFVGGVQIGF